MRTVQDIANNIICVAVSLKIYSAAEVGEENAGCRSIFVQFEHDSTKTDRNDLLGFIIELSPDKIHEYEFDMWDGRSFQDHLKDMGV